MEKKTKEKIEIGCAITGIALLFIFLGVCCASSGGAFEGTIVPDIIQCIIMCGGCVYSVFIMTSNIFKYKAVIWFISAIITLIVSVTLFIVNRTIFGVFFGAIVVVLLIFLVLFTIKQKLDK